MFTYERSTGNVMIEWWEKKKDASTPVRHYYEKRPIILQHHPKEPHLDSAVQQLANLIPEVCDEKWKQTLVKNRDNIKHNLHHYPDLFQPYGLYYRPEEVSGEGGCLLIEHSIIPDRMSGESDEDYKLRIEAHGKLERLIFELTTRLPDPVPDEEEITAEPSKEDVPNAESDDDFGFGSEDAFGFGEDMDSFEFSDDEESFGFEDSEETVEGDNEALFGFEEHQNDAETSQATAHPTVPQDNHVMETEGLNQCDAGCITAQAPELESGHEELGEAGTPEGDEQETQFTAESLDTAISTAAELEEEEELPTLQLKIVDVNDKKSGTFAGQLSLF